MSTKQDHKRWRKEFNRVCLGRDHSRCVICLSSDRELDVHHITPRKKMPNGGYVQENGISLCEACHVLVEEWLTLDAALEDMQSGAVYAVAARLDQLDWCRPAELYKRIGFSKEEAIAASEALK